METAPQKSEREIQKTQYFSRLALHMKSAFELHKNEGNLWEEKNGKRDWGNVSEHCLVEVARVDALAKLLGLSLETVKNLEYAAALHDFSKRKEKELKVPEGGITWDQYEKEISEYSMKTIQEHGFSREVAELAESVGHGSLLKIEEMLQNPEKLDEHDVAYLTMHYVDNYTRGDGWVIPTDGVTNEIDARALKDKNNPTLKNLQEDAKKFFGDRHVYTEVMVQTGHNIEKLFVKIIKEKKNLDIESLKLPEYIDEEIRKNIQKESA